MSVQESDVFQIAGLVIRIAHGDIKLPRELYDFKTGKDKPSDIHIVLKKTDVFTCEIKDGERILVCDILSIYEQPDSILVVYEQPELVYGYRVYKDKDIAVIYVKDDDVSKYDTCHIELKKKETGEKITGEELFLYAIRDSFFYHAQKAGRIAVHSASIVYQGKVYMFSAPSGTGKSTHVEQWEKAQIPFELFNGDVTMCYVRDNQVMAAGLPWSGTSGIYRNDEVLLGGVLFLKRGKEDTVNQITLADGVLRLNARCLTPNWTRETVERNLQAIEAMMDRLIIGDLYCTPTVDAAIIARKYLDEMAEDRV